MVLRRRNLFFVFVFSSSGKHISAEIELRSLRNSFRLRLRLLSNHSGRASVLFFAFLVYSALFHCFFFIRTMSLHTRITSVFLHVPLLFYVGFFLFPWRSPRPAECGRSTGVHGMTGQCLRYTFLHAQLSYCCRNDRRRRQ